MSGSQWRPPPSGPTWGPPAFRTPPHRLPAPPMTRGFHGPPAGWRPPAGAQGWRPSSPTRSTGGAVGCLAVIAFLFMVVTVLMVMGGAMALMTSPGVPGTPESPTPVRTSEPSAEPPPATPAPPAPVPVPPQEPDPVGIPDRDFPPLPPPTSVDPSWMVVQQASIYAATIPDLSGCPAPALLATMADLEPYAAAELHCVQEAWRPVLAGLGLPSTDIPHYYFEGSSATSACGTMVAPAFYCSAGGGAIYFGGDMVLDTAWDPIWAKDIVSHEYGHHLQGVSGFFEALPNLPPGNESLRRNELQATCLGFAMLRRDDSTGQDRAFYDTLEPHLRSYLDDDVHGSPDSLAHWGMRGFHAELVGECNTWVADGAEVR